MKSFSSSDGNVKMIGAGGNSITYLSGRDEKGEQSVVIKVPKSFVDRRVDDMIKRHKVLKQHGIKTTAFIEECLLDGKRAIVTENLHQADYTYLDCNAHLLREEDKLLRLLNNGSGSQTDEKEPEEERRFTDNRFREITNLIKFAIAHIAFLKKVSDAGIYLAYDSYFFKVNRQEKTDIDYIIADWDDVMGCTDGNLYERNKEQFKTALWQFVDKFVVEEIGEKYKGEILNLK